jgi:hypothetical protein
MRRIEALRWEYGAVVPESWSSRMSRGEHDYLRSYGDILTDYMKAVRLDLTSDLQPPKHLYVLVRVKQALGEVALASGSFVKLTQGTTLLLRRSDVEQLVRRGALEELDVDG